MIANVAITTANRSFDMLFSYLVDDCMKDLIHVGDRVHVPFGRGNKPTEAFVFELLENSSGNNKEQQKELKSVNEIITKNDIRLSIDQIKIAYWMKKRYMCTYAQAIKCMLPSYTTTNGSKIKFYKLAISEQDALDAIEKLKLKSLSQIMIINLLIDNDELPSGLICASVGVGVSVLKTLEKHGYIQGYQKAVELKNKKENISKDIDNTGNPVSIVNNDEKYGMTKHDLNAEQLAAYNAVIDGDDPKRSSQEKVYVLHGITGSGKTEVYLQLIEHYLEKGEDAIVLVPEISLTTMMIQRFECRFPGEVSVLHSRMTTAEKRRSWKKIYDGKSRVVVGPRSAVFAPMRNLGIIVIDEEHETTYKSEMVPKYHATEIARFRASLCGARIILGSATPSIETFYRAKKGEFTLLTLKNRTNNQSLPSVELIDMKEELLHGNTGMFSDKLKESMRNNYRDGRQTILFINKRGYASFVMCRECGYVVQCPNCSVSMKYHKSMNRLICHHCGMVQRPVEKCPNCDSKRIKQFGIGTQRVEEEIKMLFPDASVLRMDRDTTSGRESHREILEQFERDNTNFLIGTQMISKGLDFENVTLVGILDADSALFANEFRGGERAFQQITQASGRAGRGRFPGTVVVQTYNPDNICIQTAQAQDYETFYENEILLRRQLSVPPFTNIGMLVIHGMNAEKTANAAKEIYEDAISFTQRLVSIDNDVDHSMVFVAQPSISPVGMLNKRLRWRIIFKSTRLDALVMTLAHCQDVFYGKKKEDIDVSVDINPMNMI